MKGKLLCKWNDNLAYNLEDDGCVLVSCYYGKNKRDSFMTLISRVCLDDFYNSENNIAFRSYSEDIIKDDEGNIGCVLSLWMSLGKTKVQLFRESLGELFEVLYCFNLGGVEKKEPEDDEDGFEFEMLFSSFIELVEKDSSGRKKRHLESAAEKF